MYLTTSERPFPYWGVIMKSNGNGTYFGVSVEYVNRNDRGFVDFEKMIGLDGIALINVVADPEMATITGTKQLQSRITHNDGELASIYIFSAESSALIRWLVETADPTRLGLLGTAIRVRGYGKLYHCMSF